MGYRWTATWASGTMSAMGFLQAASHADSAQSLATQAARGSADPNTQTLARAISELAAAVAELARAEHRAAP